jgi:hypothetical protein
MAHIFCQYFVKFSYGVLIPPSPAACIVQMVIQLFACENRREFLDQLMITARCSCCRVMHRYKTYGWLGRVRSSTGLLPAPTQL